MLLVLRFASVGITKIKNMEEIIEQKTDFEQIQDIISAFSERKTKMLQVHGRLIPILNKELHNKYPKAKIKWAGLFGAKFMNVVRVSSSNTFKKERFTIEETTDKNAEIIGGFVEHCKQEGFDIPEHLFQSYFGA